MYKFYFPIPIAHMGLFSGRRQLIQKFQDNNLSQNFVFQSSLPRVDEVYSYVQLVNKNQLANQYLGSLFTDKDPWKSVAGFADLDNLYKGCLDIVEYGYKRSYFMTNTAGHHADNQHYELFCPFNHLFFLVETLNYQTNFPEILWVDIDAHFGNGDKKLWDSYKQKMSKEVNNVTGISLHNDAGNIQEEGYMGVHYTDQITSQDFLELLQQQTNNQKRFQYILLFFGTDIFKGDYGGNSQLRNDIIPQIISLIEDRAQESQAHLMIVQTGGKLSENIEALISCLAQD